MKRPNNYENTPVQGEIYSDRAGWSQNGNHERGRENVKD